MARDSMPMSAKPERTSFTSREEQPVCTSTHTPGFTAQTGSVCLWKEQVLV